MKSLEESLWKSIKEKIHNPVYESTATESQFVWNMGQELIYDRLIQTVGVLNDNIRA